MWKSLKAYITDLGYWGIIVIAPIALDIIGVYQLATGDEFTRIPSWVWFQVAFVLLLLIPFIAYHKVRMRLQKISEDRARELGRLILEVRDKASSVVQRSKLKDYGKTELMNDYDSYNEAMNNLHREAEIDGDQVSEIIFSGFSTFVSFHVTRFLAWDGKVISDSDTKKKLEIDELQFVGKAASRAAQTIQKLKEFTK